MTDDAPAPGEASSGLPAASEAARPSLHERIVSEIRDRILTGAWPPGYRIPYEHALAEQYGCARMTVNKALTELARAGLIERRRRSGSFVRQPRSHSAVLEIHDIETEVRALGLSYGYRLLEAKRRLAGEAGEPLDVAAGAPLLELRCLHLAGGAAFCLEERLINLEAVPEAADADFADVAPGAWLIAQVPWSAAEHHIRAISADRALARELEAKPGAACLAIERRTWSGGVPITWTRLTYRGESHGLVARFEPDLK